jgi:8-oxo-dGTP diphosphatase
MNDQISAKEVIEAAGGVILRSTATGYQAAIIHRKRYDDWTLPKGKRELGESWQETALREVHEETGCPVILGEFIGSTAYSIDQGPKVVLFWMMHIQRKSDCKFEPNSEVDLVKWVTLDQALTMLNYPAEKDILRKAFKIIEREP